MTETTITAGTKEGQMVLNDEEMMKWSEEELMLIEEFSLAISKDGVVKPTKVREAFIKHFGVTDEPLLKFMVNIMLINASLYAQLNKSNECNCPECQESGATFH